jgi:hypothetical protein
MSQIEKYLGKDDKNLKKILWSLKIYGSEIQSKLNKVAGEIRELAKLRNYGNNFEEKREHICEIIEKYFSVISRMKVRNTRNVIY